MKSNQTSPEILVVSAEASSTLYAKRLLEEWSKQGLNLHAFGIGSREMESLGFEIVGRSEELAVVGFKEVIAHYPKIRSVFYNLIDLAKKRRPKLALLLDYPDFNLRLAKKLKALGIPVVYYISPQVWAWRKGRIKQIKKNVERMLVVFPFEVDFYKKNGVEVNFVGHPLLEEITPDLRDITVRAQRRSRFGIDDDDIVLGLMPGSRRSEIKNHLIEQIKTAELLAKEIPDLHVILLLAPGLIREEIAGQLPKSELPITLVQKEPFEMLQLCDIVLCASGTATLMAGLMRVPMVIMYKMNSFSAWLAKKLVTTTAFFGMVNLILKKEVVPERFQEQAAPDLLARELENLIKDKSRRENIILDLSKLDGQLGEKGAAKRVTEIIKGYIQI